MLLTIAAFLLAILLLVSLHELGHFAVARLMGVKVLRFSVGFGTPFWKKKIGNTEWCLAPIPLGGYVRMVDTREGDVPEADLPYAFDLQHPAKKIAIVAAGPLTNLILAVLLFAASYTAGVTQIRPIVGTVADSSAAAAAGFRAGDVIETVNGSPVADWGQARAQIVLSLDAGEVKVGVRSADGKPAERTIDVAGSARAGEIAKTGDLGMMPFKLTNRLSEVLPGSAAAEAGLKSGDLLLSVDGKPLERWTDFADTVRNSAGRQLTVAFERGGREEAGILRPHSQVHNGEIYGVAGVRPSPDTAWNADVESRTYPGVLGAVKLGAEKTGEYIQMTLSFLGRLIIGQASFQHLSGPLTIADVAGKTAAIGWQSYVEFLALVSVSLGILNLLPIPVLDGGHLLYYAVEWIKGRPLSLQTQQLGIRFGLAIMLLMMCVAFFNDITRLFG